MAILNIETAQPAGLTSVIPNLIYVNTSDTYAQVTAIGYLTAQSSQGYTFSNEQMALVYTSDEGAVWLKVVITYSGSSVLNTVVSLVQVSSPGDVTLPTIANHMIVSTDTAGSLANLAGTAINSGSVQAGLSGTTGSLISYPTTAAKGSLVVKAVDNTGDTLVTVSNALHGQASVVSIPDGGQATAEFIISDSAGTQAITSGNLQVQNGNVIIGDNAAPAAQKLTMYTPDGQGLIHLAPVNTGPREVTISNALQSQTTVVSIPDVASATATFAMAPAALVSGNVVTASGTAGLIQDGGFAVLANSASWGGGGTSNAFTATGVTTSSIVTASILASTNAVSIVKVVPTANVVTIDFSGDPGAATQISFIAITPAV
jgi:hypothetical protein